MSLIICKGCARYIDSDDDPDCFVYTGNYKRLHGETILCEVCREERQAEQDALDEIASRVSP